MGLGVAGGTREQEQNKRNALGRSGMNGPEWNGDGRGQGTV